MHVAEAVAQATAATALAMIWALALRPTIFEKGRKLKEPASRTRT